MPTVEVVESRHLGGFPTGERITVTESPWSLLFGALIFGYAGFMFAWSTHPAAQMAMWSLRGLSIAFASTLLISLIAPRLGGRVRLIVVGLAAVLLCGSGAWILVVNGGRDLFGWLLIIMGLFDAAEVWRWMAQRRLVQAGQHRAPAAPWDEDGP